MPRQLTALALLAALIAPARAAAPGTSLEFSGFLSAWRQDCTNGCALPAGAGPSEAAGFKLDVPMNPGEARTARLEREFTLAPSGEKIKAVVTAYFLCPRGSKGEPGGDSCPARYVQAQVALSGDAKAFCAASLNPADAHPFPVLMCAGENLRRPGERIGISLSRQAVAAAAE